MSTMNATVSAVEVDDSSLHNEHRKTSAASLSLCPLCYEEDLSAPPTPGVILSTCRHHSCRACMVKWIEREEASGQARPPTCPFCRSTIIEEDVLTILGRPFQPRQATANNPNGDDEIDELTLQWINEHTLPCGGCGSLIEKESGCDLIECLCGYRFCFSCGVAGGECPCNPGHIFPDDASSLNDEYIPHAPIMDGSGRVDLRSCIRRREVSSKRMKKRSEELYRWEYSEKNAAVCTSNGRWLFTPARDTRCILMLTQQLSYDSSRDGRVCHRRASRRQCNTTRDTSWLFLCEGADYREMQRLFFKYEVRGGNRFKMKHIMAAVRAAQLVA
mmetsp:Transcript_10105/g.18206  ORF Transcript_10105/g.18206 Transcript_10105/m.18206 type:complete len:331 (-) Transcript_10105:179-1171(-)|eukprot:CAMPEP_0201877156 /NCGR_PEP_ID=MMETSP0902-20130614/8636_1 /ASSEMBLY_ACC=CAM_ASM_000551 /TAXON_ID=420261 /ORGANISM="Thalassiosira antarctica, Strain CCMP982" /LENGTH=330 /DNA_ID=CAMNT_0048404537 /DNA_START=26 /DNA_END=1018 /DNA_ORIENTATION=-